MQGKTVHGKGSERSTIVNMGSGATHENTTHLQQPPPTMLWDCLQKSSVFRLGGEFGEVEK
jgi:hypothetical protein